jgi:hypothetical protein
MLTAQEAPRQVVAQLALQLTPKPMDPEWQRACDAVLVYLKSRGVEIPDRFIQEEPTA